jgi:hypothetical protein
MHCRGGRHEGEVMGMNIGRPHDYNHRIDGEVISEESKIYCQIQMVSKDRE